jgi:hypothetical protein
MELQGEEGDIMSVRKGHAVGYVEHIPQSPKGPTPPTQTRRQPSGYLLSLGPWNRT